MSGLLWLGPRAGGCFIIYGSLAAFHAGQASRVVIMLVRQPVGTPPSGSLQLRKATDQTSAIPVVSSCMCALSAGA